ncbi:MAG: hypothetical protein AAFQ91_32770 [Cyanobacteria bacterium J06621_15]
MFKSIESFLLFTSPNEDKVEAIKEYPVPKNVKQVKSFLGLSGFYRRFIPQYGMIATPLTNLTRENQPFIWGREQQEAFDTLDQSLALLVQEL